MAHPVDITDPDDPRVDDFRDLTTADRRPDRPGGRGLAIGEGTIVVERMSQSRYAPTALLGVPRRYDELRDALATIDAPYYRASAETMAEVVGFHLNRGVLAIAPKPRPLDLDDVLRDARTIAVLEGIGDHENLGAIFRHAAALQVDAVVVGPRCSDPLYRRAIRVSMGHVLRVPHTTVDDWDALAGALGRHGFRTVALTPQPPAIALSAAIDAPRIAFLLGAEGPGLSDHALRLADVRACIPMTPGVDSLNVATAGAIAFYERSREDAARAAIGTA
ncbi:TrmH family RNA methyltransferase [Lolliginicoccus suaedae]|uniref:TrmH family RNA methyltransferase n=1 Tax=Lolliginicoccus suaedae TaxID=2605429 RepID=UPI0011EFA10C|nr:RNA methyltransferase [Lolliginicoccus suaedae]